MNIIATTSQNLYLNCQGSQSCGFSNVYTRDDGDNFVLNCTSKPNETVYYHYGACEHMNVYSNNIKNVYVDCNYDHDCYNTDFYVNNAENIDFNFNDNKTGDLATIYAQNVSNSVNVLCNGEYSCYRTEIYCPYSVYGMFLCL